MASCARYGCTREECRRAQYLDKKRADLDRANGVTGRVDAAPSARRIGQLMLLGMSIGDITDRSGVSASSIRAIARARYVRIYRTTQDAILGIPLPQTATAPANRGYISAIGAKRRLQALSARGWPREAIATRVGLSPRTVGDIRRGEQRSVYIDHHQEINRVYEELWNKRPEDFEVSALTARRLRNFAKRQGWLLPAELDDDEIDWAAA
jgi:transcriptional regulator with XRE-family HTH domain